MGIFSDGTPWVAQRVCAIPMSRRALRAGELLKLRDPPVERTRRTVARSRGHSVENATPANRSRDTRAASVPR